MITATTSSPYFVEACLPVVCTAFSNGTSLGSGCRCNRGYNGTITAVTASVNSNMYTGICASVSCPPGCSGTSVTSGCLCMAGYSGTIILSGNTGAPFYTGSCVALVCPVYSTSINAGGKLHEGCICNSGYVGTISATTLSPNFFSGSCVILSCPMNSRRNTYLSIFSFPKIKLINFKKKKNIIKPFFFWRSAFRFLFLVFPNIYIYFFLKEEMDDN